MSSAIAIVDANCFYVSCERVFNAGLVKRPVVVLSNNDGCIIARSDEAKELGLKMGAPLFKNQHLIEAYDVAVYSSNYALYGDMSQRVMEALQEFTPEIEIYSIDEAFIGLEAQAGKSFQDRGTEIRGKVYRWTGIPLSIGISQTKTLAKVAQRFARKRPEAQGVLDLTDSSRQSEVLEETSIDDVWGIGRAYSKLLRDAGINTARKLRDADRRWIRRRLTVVGARIVEELRGIRCLSIEQCPQQKKSVTCSRSFGRLVTSLDDLREAVAVYTTRVAERLRRAGLAARVLTVFINTDRFSTEPQYSNTVTYELASATDTTDELLEWTLKGLDSIYRRGFKYKKAGVMLNHLVPADQLSIRMFGNMSYERSRSLAKAMDEINRRHGRDTIRFGLGRADGSWKTKFLRCSPHYTTSLSEVLRLH